MPPKRKNVIGYSNNKLTVLRDLPDRGKFRYVRCKCSCGNETSVRMTSVKNGDVKSCGCAYFEGNKEKCKTHGMSATRFYYVWKTLKNRCENPNVEKYAVYGARGIKCLWRSFEEFRDDMYEAYLLHKKQNGSLGTTIERENVNGHYSKANCRWATFREQAQNKQCHANV